MSKAYRGPEGVERDIRQGIRNGLAVSASTITGAAVRQTPKDKGTLRASADWNLEDAAGFTSPKLTTFPDSIRATISFNTPYAEVQHENEEFRHSQGNAKYLERAVLEKAGGVMGAVAAAIRGELGGL